MSVLRRWPWQFLAIFGSVCACTGLFWTPSPAIAQATRTVAVADDDDEEESEEDEDREDGDEEDKPAGPTVDPNTGELIPGRTAQQGFSVRKEDPKVVDAFEDFRRHSKAKAWELAFKAIQSVAEKDPKGMVPAGDGLMVPTRQRVWQALATLPPEGREAYRLFNDANAKQQFEKASSVSGGAAEVAALQAIFQLYFVTSVGDEAADRLGDACFESGDFLAADAAWKAVLDHYPDTNLSKTRLRLKRCAALSRAGRWDTFEEVAASLGKESTAETMRLAGKEVSAAQYLAALREQAEGQPQLASRTERRDPSGAPAVTTASIELPRQDKPVWQVRFMDDSLAEQFQQALRNMGWGNIEAPVSSSVPPAVTDGKRVYLNWLGIAFAVDANTGKLLWRSRKFSDLTGQAQQFAYGGVNISRYEIALHGNHVLVTGLPLDQINQGMGGAYRLVCHNAETGAVVWTTKTGDVAPFSIASAPFSAGDTLYVVANRLNQQEMHLLALSADKGKLQWSVQLGTPQASVNYRGQSQSPSPLVVQHAGMLYVLTNNGGVLAVDPANKRLEWAFSCEPPPIMNSNEMMFFDPDMIRRQPVKTPGAAFVRDSVLYFKEAGGYAVYALDLAGPKLKWKRAAEPSEMIIGIGGGAGGASGGTSSPNLFLAGSSASAIDLSSRAMRWSTNLPVETGMLRPILGGDRLYVFSGRGIFALDTATGDPAGRPFRGADMDSLGGALLQCGEKLVTVSNLTVTAYPLPSAAVRQSSAQ